MPNGNRQFSSEEEFLKKFKKYIEFCKKNEQLANIAGFAVFLDMCRDTFYAQKEYYPSAFSKIQDILEDYTINAKIRDTFKIFYMKNKFNYKDRTEIDANNTGRIKIVNDLSRDEEDEWNYRA